jgi:hypothetical protein
VVREHGIFVASMYMDKREMKVSVYVGDHFCYNVTMTSEEALEKTQEVL